MILHGYFSGNSLDQKYPLICLFGLILFYVFCNVYPEQVSCLVCYGDSYCTALESVAKVIVELLQLVIIASWGK